MANGISTATTSASAHSLASKRCFSTRRSSSSASASSAAPTSSSGSKRPCRGPFRDSTHSWNRLPRPAWREGRRGIGRARSASAPSTSPASATTWDADRWAGRSRTAERVRSASRASTSRPHPPAAADPSAVADPPSCSVTRLSRAARTASAASPTRRAAAGGAPGHGIRRSGTSRGLTSRSPSVSGSGSNHPSTGTPTSRASSRNGEASRGRLPSPHRAPVVSNDRRGRVRAT